MPEAMRGASHSSSSSNDVSANPPARSDEGSENDERKLVEQAKAGDQTALDRLFDGNYERVYRYIRFKVNQEQDAEDIAQETFLRMYQALDRFQQRGVPFRAWLMQIATNLVNDFYRKRGSTGRAWSIEEGELDPTGGGDPAELVLDLLSVQEAVAAMSSLTELERDVIQLRYAAELSIAETAAALGKNENNVKQLTFKALGKLRKVMSQQDAGNSQA